MLGALGAFDARPELMRSPVCRPAWDASWPAEKLGARGGLQTPPDLKTSEVLSSTDAGNQQPGQTEAQQIDRITITNYQQTEVLFQADKLLLLL